MSESRDEVVDCVRQDVDIAAAFGSRGDVSNVIVNVIEDT